MGPTSGLGGEVVCDNMCWVQHQGLEADIRGSICSHVLGPTSVMEAHNCGCICVGSNIRAWRQTTEVVSDTMYSVKRGLETVELPTEDLLAINSVVPTVHAKSKAPTATPGL